MTLSGAAGEALVVTDRRVVIAREQMSIVGGQREIDSFDYSFEQIRGLLVDLAAGGGYLRLVLFAPPPDEQHISLYFPSYMRQKFEHAAARIRIMLEPTHISVIGSGPSSNGCKKCGADLLLEAFFCSGCGTPRGRICPLCRQLLMDDSLFCPGCGVSVETARPLSCPECQGNIAPQMAYCPVCGRGQETRCPSCRQSILTGWNHCSQCGGRLGIPTTDENAGGN